MDIAEIATMDVYRFGDDIQCREVLAGEPKSASRP